MQVRRNVTSGERAVPGVYHFVWHCIFALYLAHQWGPHSSLLKIYNPGYLRHATCQWLHETQDKPGRRTRRLIHGAASLDGIRLEIVCSVAKA